MSALYPSYKGLQPASTAISQAKQACGSSDTRAEMLLRRHLWQHGWRFRKNLSALPGKPDTAFTSARIAVFCDGDFWHGRHWDKLKSKLMAGFNPDYWTAKIALNRKRDIQVSRELKAAGWVVIRLWETDILNDPEWATAVVIHELKSRRAVAE